LLWLDWLKLIIVILLIMNGVPYSVRNQDTDWFESLWRKGFFLFSIMSKQSLLTSHSTTQPKGKWMKWPGREADLHLVTRAETIGAKPPLTLHVAMDHTGKCSPLIFNSTNNIDNIRLNCIFYVMPCRTILRSM
jgi:hypothetical protein